jgi:hypothetical protein
VGQLATLRRLAGAPIKGENYFVADIAVGLTGAEQARANREFDSLTAGASVPDSL